MNAAMVHRGPDDEGIHVDPATGMALAARRLSIIDVAGGHQPLANEQGSVWAALNGEIYNHPLLQRRLRARGHRLATGTDTEVLVHLYEDQGPALVHALEGMYAFAVWDAHTRSLLVARDRMGEKPLFYAERDGELMFASELTALLAGLSGAPEIDAAAMDAYFVFGYVPGPGSLVRGIRQLPPGHLLTWRPGGGPARVERYWEPPVMPRRSAEGPAALVDEVAERLGAAVRSRMISDVPLGVFLSGGLDSTLIAGLAARDSTAEVKTFTVGYDTGEVSEAAPARRTAAALGTDHHELVLSGADIARRVPGLLGALDQPVADPALVALHAVAELARSHVTVAIGGEGADELFGGYPRYGWLERAEQLGRVLPAAAGRAGASMLATVATTGRMRRFEDVLRPQSALERHLDWVTAGRRHGRAQLYGPRLASLRAESCTLLDLEAIAGPADTASVAGRFMRLDQRHWLPDDVLVKADRAGMLVSLEVRTPYLERELVELACTISPSVHMQRGGKHLLRAVLKRLLPDAAWPRAKTAFRVPVGDWLAGPLRPALEAQLEGGRLYADGWFDRERVRALATEHSSRTQDRSAVLWPLLALGLWLDGLPRAG